LAASQNPFYTLTQEFAERRGLGAEALAFAE
jgi:hypothetical protein